MFTIKIKNLQTRTMLGIYKWEKREKRQVVLNITLEVATDKAGYSDDMKDAVDYNIEEQVIKRLESSSYNLIERLVTDITEFILSLDDRITKITVEADKPGALKQAESVSVSLTLSRQAS